MSHASSINHINHVVYDYVILHYETNRWVSLYEVYDYISYVTYSNEMSHVSEFDFEKTPYKHATMLSDDFYFLPPG